METKAGLPSAVSRQRFISKVLLVLWVVAAFTFLVPLSRAQQLTGTLSATVYDQAGAVIPNAKVVLRNTASGDTRTTVTDNAGYFNFSAVQPATYSVTISATGFSTWNLTGLVMSQGDNRTIADIVLRAGQTTTTVEVVADKDVQVSLDTAEISTTMNAQQIEDMSLGGRDVGELLKMMPGAALTNGLSQGSSFNPKVTGTNSGPVGAYSLNGTQPNGAMAYMLDGANLVDPGNMGTQIANINQDMTQEVKVLTSNYGAEYAKGPVIFEAFSKSGGQAFHGVAYVYARNSALNSWESYAKSQYVNDKNDPNLDAQAIAKLLKPDEHFYYYGGNIGGPVLLPFTQFNRNRDKLFFWTGYEYMNQHPAATPINYNVPTVDQKNGIFANPNTQPAGVMSTYGYAYYTPAPQPGIDTGWTTDSTGAVHIPTSNFDPNILGLLKAAFPNPNLTPSAGNGWSNYAYVPNVPQNRWEATGKLDYAITENSKLTGSYTFQSEVDQHPIAIWWAAPWTLPYPGGVNANTTSQEILTNFTHVFSPTTTNEFVFTFARYINPNKLGNPKAVDRTNLGMNVPGLFGHTTSQIPNIVGQWGGSLPYIGEMSFDGSFDGGAFGGLKRVPALYDTLSKVIGSHTAKVGFYWDRSENIQSSSNADNGAFNMGWAQYGTGNIVSDFLLGRPGSYSQASGVPVDDIKFSQWSVWAQDSWKANRKLTLNYGLRADHLGQWYGVPTGFQVWDPGSYVDAQNAPPNTGLLWHAINSSVPLSGFTSPLFYYSPRIGYAYDIFGTGKTVLRMGIGAYRYQLSTAICNNNACDGPRGTFTYTTTLPFVGYANVAKGGAPPSSVSQSSWLSGSTIGVLKKGDSRTPLTVNWNVTLDQALPWRSVAEFSYVASKSTGEFINGANGKYDDLNNILPGGLWKPDPITGQYISPNAPNNSGYPTYNEADFRPLHNYGDVYLMTHGSYANYNSLQASWRKSGSVLNFQANYTFSKVLGIWDGDTSNGAGNGTMVDPFNLRNNYGPLGYDHTHIFNVWYIYSLPSPMHNPLLATVINGWKLSGWNTYQSGAPIQPNAGALNAVYPSNSNGTALFKMPNGLYSTTMNASSWLGTPSINLLEPVLTCDPRKGLKSGYYFNPGCFTTPTVVGQQGTLRWPYMRGPAYVTNDLSIFKSFKTTEKQSIELRIQGQNFINHPLRQFGLAGNSDIQLVFNTIGGGNTNATTTGRPAFTTGQRLMTFSAKYHF
jgi:hypothetical protein